MAEKIIDDMERADARLVQAASEFNRRPLDYIVESAWGGFARLPDFAGDGSALAVINSLERQIREYPEYVEAMEQEASEDSAQKASDSQADAPTATTLSW